MCVHVVYWDFAFQTFLLKIDSNDWNEVVLLVVYFFLFIYKIHINILIQLYGFVRLFIFFIFVLLTKSEYLDCFNGLSRWPYLYILAAWYERISRIYNRFSFACVLCNHHCCVVASSITKNIHWMGILCKYTEEMLWHTICNNVFFVDCLYVIY